MLLALAKNIVRNTRLLVATQAISMICSILFNILCARYLGKVGFGKYIFAWSFVSIFIALGTLNVPAKAARDVARDFSRSETYLSNLPVLGSVLSIVVFLVSVLILLLMQRDHDLTLITILFSGVTIFQIATACLSWWFQAYQELHYEALLVVSLSVAKLLLAIVVILLKGGLIALVLITVVANCVVLILCYCITTHRFSELRWRVDIRFVGRFILQNVPFALSVAFASVYGNIDKILLSMLKGDAVTGLYGAANQILIPIKVIPGALSLAILPVFSQLYGTDRRHFDRLLRSLLRYVLLIAFPMAIAFTALAREIIIVLFGEAFVDGSLVLTIAAWGAVAIFLNVTLGKAVLAAGEERLNAVFCGVGLLINIILNLILIPRFAHIGAAASNLAAEGIISVLVLYWAYRKSALKNFSFWQNILKPFLAAAAMGAFIYPFKSPRFMDIGSRWSGCLSWLSVGFKGVC